MPLRLAELQDRYRAVVLGFAIGDGLGFPLRGLPPPSVGRASTAEDFAPRPRGRFAKGQFSDDTQMMLAVAEAVARERKIDGKTAAAHLSWLWQEGVILQPPASATDAAQQLLHGTPWMSAGAPIGVTDPSCLSRGVVIGLWSEPTPTRLAHDAQVLTIMTHKDPLCSAAVAAFARALQLGMSSEQHTPQTFCEEVARAAAPNHPDLAEEIFHLPRALGWDADRALITLRRIGVSASQFDFDAGVPAHVTPVLLTALFCALHSGERFRDALTLVLRAGGEVDVTAAITAAIVAARLGTDGLPVRLKKNILYADSLTDAADRLFDARLSREPAVTTPVFSVLKR